MEHRSAVYEVVRSEVTEIGRFKIHMDSVLKDGREYPYSYIEERSCAVTLALYKGNIILEKQYRHALKAYELELPGGAIDCGEDPQTAAERELIEETGFQAKTMRPLGKYYLSPGTSTAACFLYVADCEKAAEPKREALEYIDIVTAAPNEFDQMIKDGRFTQSMGLVAWLKYRMLQESSL